MSPHLNIIYPPVMNGVQVRSILFKGVIMYQQVVVSVLILLLLLPITAIGQTGYLRSYGGSVTEFGTDIALRPDGQIVISSQTQTPELSFGICDGLVPLIDPEGNVIDAIGIGSTDCDILDAIGVNSQGDVFAAGRTLSGGNGEYDAQVIRMNGALQPLWSRRAGGPSSDHIHSLVATDDGGVVVAGSYGTTTFDLDLWLMKLDANGNMLWSRIYPGPGTDRIEKVILSSDGGFLCTGTSGNAGTGMDLMVMRTDASGLPLWRRNIGGTSSEEGRGICEGPDGSAYAFGWTRSFGAGMKDAFLCKVGLTGNLLWARSYGGAGNEEGDDIVRSVNGSLILTGTIAHGFFVNDNVFLISVDLDGNITWQKEYGDELRLENAERMTIDASGGLYVTGDVWGCPGLDYQILLLHTDGQGNCSSCETQSLSFISNLHSPSVTISAGVQGAGQVTEWSPLTSPRSIGEHHCGQMMPLAVTLLYADVEENGPYNTINWATASEFGADHFRVERSVDGIRFDLIASVPAAGSSHITTRYSCTDPMPAPLTYYRLTEVDRENDHIELAMLTAQRDDQNSVEVDHTTRTILMTLKNTVTEVRVIDMTGKVIFRERNGSGVVQTIAPDKGVYLILFLSNGAEQESVKIIL
jgi:hypothetical protein